MIANTTRALSTRFREAVVARHPYDAPAVVVVPIIGGDPAFLSWIGEETRTPGGRSRCRTGVAPRLGQNQGCDGQAQQVQPATSAPATTRAQKQAAYRKPGHKRSSDGHLSLSSARIVQMPAGLQLLAQKRYDFHCIGAPLVSWSARISWLRRRHHRPGKFRTAGGQGVRFSLQWSNIPTLTPKRG